MIVKELLIFQQLFQYYWQKDELKNHACKNYIVYLSNENPNSFFLSPTDKEEIELILSSLDISKATRLYIIPNKALELLKNDISNRTANLFII